MKKNYDPADQNLMPMALQLKYEVSHGQHPYYTRSHYAIGTGPLPSKGDYWAWVRDCLKLDKAKDGEAPAVELTPEQKAVEARRAKLAALPPLKPGEARVLVDNDKYEFFMRADGGIEIKRYDEPWVFLDSNTPGIKAFIALVCEAEESNVLLGRLDAQFGQSNETINKLLVALDTLKAQLYLPAVMDSNVEKVLSYTDGQIDDIVKVYRDAENLAQTKGLPADQLAARAWVRHRFLALACRHGATWKSVGEAELMALGAHTYDKVHVPDTDIATPDAPKLIVPGQ
jgi:hypothetical protein